MKNSHKKNRGHNTGSDETKNMKTDSKSSSSMAYVGLLLGVLAIALFSSQIFQSVGGENKAAANLQAQPTTLPLAGAGETPSTISSAKTVSATPETAADEDLVRVPLSDISSTGKKLTHQYNGETLRYLVVEGSDGLPRIAFDACEVCGGAKGYRQSGTDVICNNCGRHFSIDSIGASNMGCGCWPSHIPHTVEGDEVVIKTSDLQKGAKYF